jgi:thiamine biosynthesis lipoprotein
MNGGSVATSSFCRRLWVDSHGKPCHHLLSPLDGRPVWNNLAGVAALAPTALEAETRAKWALLSGSAHPLVYGGIIYPADPKESPQEVGLTE